MIVTKTYLDGTTATGKHPLPKMSPSQQDRLKINDYYSFGARLKEIRLQKGLTQCELEKLAGLPSMVLSHYENGTRKPGLDNIRMICNGLNCSASELLCI